MTTSQEPLTPWWGDFEVAAGKSARWRVGPFRLTAWRSPQEWRLVWRREGDALTGGVEVAADGDPGEVEGEVLRIVSGGTASLLNLVPRLADRSVVARPETPFRLLPDSEIGLYVSTVAWISATVDEPPEQVLDVPSWRLSDTWFGSPAGAGELGYAIRTNARLSLENLPVLPHRVVTKVIFTNRARRSISLDRLSLPLPGLSIYAGTDSRLWTQCIYAEIERDGDLAQLDIGRSPPEEAAEPRLVSGPREVSQKNVLVRALGALVQ